ncbi:S-layer family protein [Aetokthonos hydrillicola]|uniref:S-layer family protein n=1 Tax=Aetokthonos hydrillicola TaxID=1550245 RepID=UPI001B065985
MTIDTGRLLALNGAQVSAATFGQGSAGDLTFRASDSVELVGTSADGRFASGVRSAVEASAVGNGGNSTFLTNRLLVQDGAEISTASSGKGNAGNLNVRANFITLNNQGKLIANSVTGEGGNVSLRVNDILLLRRNSLISNTNGTAQVGGNGGNFFLSTQFLVAPLLNNSDIITNAFNGRGGKIDITASDGVFGFDVRSQQDLARLRPSDLDPRQLSTNDISAISQNNPTIITPDADPSRGLILLPTVTEKPPKLVSSNCTAFNETAGGNNFTITGRGGLPKSPYEPLTSDAVWSDTRLPLTTAHQNQPKKQAALIKPKPIEIVPATGWVFNGKGEVTLISSVSNTTSSTPMSCAAR